MFGAVSGGGGDDVDRPSHSNSLAEVALWLRPGATRHRKHEQLRTQRQLYNCPRSLSSLEISSNTGPKIFGPHKLLVSSAVLRN